MKNILKFFAALITPYLTLKLICRTYRMKILKQSCSNNRMPQRHRVAEQVQEQLNIQRTLILWHSIKSQGLKGFQSNEQNTVLIRHSIS